MARGGTARAKRLISRGCLVGTCRAHGRGMTHRFLPAILLSFATLSGCLDDADYDPELDLGEIVAEVGTPIKPDPACGTACPWKGTRRAAMWAGHDSNPQIASDVGSGKVVRDITFCLVKSAVGTNGQKEITYNRVGAGAWYEQGVSTRLALSSATPPTTAGTGSITGWHAVTLTAFGQKLNPDVQWFELRFPVETKAQRPTGTYYLDPTGRLVPLYYRPTGYYTDVLADYFRGTKPISGQAPAPTVTLDVGQNVVYGGSNFVGQQWQTLNTWPNLTDAAYPSWESGSMSVHLGQTLNSPSSSTALTATIPIVKSGVLDIKLIASAEVRHYFQVTELQNPDALATAGQVSVDMGSKTSFKLRAIGKLDLGFFDVNIDEILFDWSPIAENKNLGKADFDGRAIRSYIDGAGRSHANPSAWLSQCLASTPSVTSERPVSDPQQWVDGIKNTVIDNVAPCPNSSPEFAIGRLCDKLGRILPTYPATPGQIGG
jgi:hypothetical protein